MYEQEEEADEPGPRPNPVVCPWCGEINEFQEYVRESGRVIWAHPSVKQLEPPVGSDEDNPTACPSCEDQARRQAHKDLVIRRLRHGGVPERCLGFSIDSLQWHDGYEHDHDFRERVWASPHWYGVTCSDAEAVRTCVDWTRYMKGDSDERGMTGPKKAGAGLFIHGAVGTGKSLLASILCSELVKGGTIREVGQEEYATHLATKWKVSYESALLEVRASTTEGKPAAYTAHRTYGVRWYSESELLRREKLSWKGDQTPIYKAMKYKGVVVLDDLDSEAGTSKGAREFAATAIERMICLRYERRLPTIITSNTHPDHLVERGYGKRVLSRVQEVYESVPLTGNGHTWRR